MLDVRLKRECRKFQMKEIDVVKGSHLKITGNGCNSPKLHIRVEECDWTGGYYWEKHDIVELRDEIDEFLDMLK